MVDVVALYLKKVSIRRRFFGGFLMIVASLVLVGVLYGKGLLQTLTFFETQLTQTHTLQKSLHLFTSSNEKSIETFP